MSAYELLLVEAEEAGRRAVRAAVRQAETRIRLVEVGTIREALEQVAYRRFDGILTAGSLPDGSGIELLREGLPAPVIMLTGLDDRELAARALKEGAQDFLVKRELDASTLLRSVRYAIERRKGADLREQLLHSDRLAAIGQLAAGVAHEINNPATFIAANGVCLDEAVSHLAEMIDDLEARARSDDALAEILARYGPRATIDEAKVMVKESTEGLDRITGIVKKLQTFSRLQQSADQTVDVNAVVDSACRMLDNEVRHRATLEKHLDADLPMIRGDSGEVNQLVTNLLVNAVQSMVDGHPARDRITVRSQIVGPFVKVSVEDSGCGIPAFLHKRVFDPFFTTKPQDKGTGLGLAICSEIVRKHGGRIELESEVGRGTAVHVLLPIHREPTGDLALVRLELEPDGRRDRTRAEDRALRILAIDDERLILSAYRRMLRGHEVTLVSGGAEALGVLAADRAYDGILCDLMMPDLDGREFHERVQELAPELVGRIVYCTGGAFTSRMRHFIASQKVPVLDKPISRDRLDEIVGYWRNPETAGVTSSTA